MSHFEDETSPIVKGPMYGFRHTRHKWPESRVKTRFSGTQQEQAEKMAAAAVKRERKGRKRFRDQLACALRNGCLGDSVTRLRLAGEK